MKIIPLLLGASALYPALCSATLIYGLTSSNGLISFDSASPGSITNIGTISQAGIRDIDFYPVNGLLYGSTSNGNLYRISVVDGTSVLAATPSLAISGLTDIDFNPVPDRLRIFAAGNQNYRMAPDVFTNNATAPGTTLLDGSFSNSSVNLVGSAYTNNVDGASTTALYSIDSISNALFLHSVAPQFNTVNSVGGLGFDVGLNVGFDVAQSGAAFLSDDQSFYSINLATGATSLIGNVGGSGLVSIAALAVPEASTTSILALATLCAFRRRRAGGKM